MEFMLPKTAEYALRAVVWLARDPDRPESADAIAAATQTPRRYLQRVLQDLVLHGLVRSQPGPHGGYSLAAESEKVTILDVVTAVAPLERIRECPLGIPAHAELCPLHRELDKAYAATEEAFSRVTIAELVELSGDKAPICQLE
jgi:Rrf2 family transcriptional regulator, nitric oxide-sensitive transcriptional repressor